MVTIGRIVETVARHYDVPPSVLLGADRHKSVTEARHVAMALARQRVGASFPELGRYFGRDHTTCIYAVRRVHAALAPKSGRVVLEEERMRLAVAAIESRLDGDDAT